ncbi:hypothetical protein DID88_007049 [Monilinia fructigena]|uniref:Uncharacterized protein n=1 Tax=Monilinia fructigena TaxID=38457 RepID=A0A395JC46_9HELO|nr:hypothetical protein DID88_007049 [Monilinia fructigena]
MSHRIKATAGERKWLPPSLDDDRITPEILNKLAALDLESERESEEEHEYQKPSCRRKDRSRESLKESKHHQTPKYQHSPSAYASEEPFSQRMPHAPSPPIFRSRFEYSSPSSYSGHTTAREEELRMRMEERLRERMAPRGTDERLQMEMEERLRERMAPRGTDERLQMEMEDRLRERMRPK